MRHLCFELCVSFRAQSPSGTRADAKDIRRRIGSIGASESPISAFPTQPWTNWRSAACHKVRSAFRHHCFSFRSQQGVLLAFFRNFAVGPSDGGNLHGRVRDLGPKIRSPETVAHSRISQQQTSPSQQDTPATNTNSAMSAKARPLTALLSRFALSDGLTLRNRVVMAPMTR